jgi:multiple sugar transport system substrate-binding protein
MPVPAPTAGKCRTDNRRSRRSTFAAGAGAIVLAGALAACGSSSTTAKPTPGHPYNGETLSVFAPAPSGANASRSRAYFNDVATLFHKETGAKVSWDYYTSSSQESSTIESSVATKSGPEVFSVGSSFDGTIAGTHAFHVLTAGDWKALGGRSSFESQMLTESGPSSTADVGVPYESIPYALAYNKTMFTKAGIKTPPTTWSQYVSDAQRVQKANPGVSGVGLDPSDSYDPWKLVWSYALQSGGNFVNSNAKTATFTSPQVQAAMNFYFEQFYKFHIAPNTQLTWQSSNVEAAFASGKVAIVPDSTYELAVELKGTKVAKDVAFAPMPDVPLGATSRAASAPPAQSIVSGNYWVVSSWAKSVPLALKFIKVTESPSVQMKQFQLLGENPVTNASIAGLLKQDAAMKPFITAEAKSTPTTFTPAWSYIEDGILAVIAHTAQQVATSGYSSSFVSTQLSAENAAVQPHLANG